MVIPEARCAGARACVDGVRQAARVGHRGLELADRSIEIVADRGIAQRVPPAEWQALAAQMRERFRAGEFEAGVMAAIGDVAQRLRTHYPLAAGARNPDELSNRPVVL